MQNTKIKSDKRRSSAGLIAVIHAYRLLTLLCLSAIVGCDPPPPKSGAARDRRQAPSEPSLAEQVRAVRQGKADSIELNHRRVSDDDLESLGDLPRLRALVLTKAGISDRGLHHLAGLTELEILTLGETTVTDDGLDVVAGMSRLTTLNFASAEVTSAGLKKLTALKHLSLLRFGKSRIGDDGLASARRMPELTQLILQNAPITAAGLEHLIGFDQLRTLYLEGSEVTEQGAQRLEASLPNLHFHW